MKTKEQIKDSLKNLVNAIANKDYNSAKKHLEAALENKKDCKIVSVIEARSITEKLTKKNQDIIDLIKQQVNLDLNPYVVDSFSNNKMVTIEIDELSQNNLANIERIANQFKRFSIQPNGAKKIALIPVSSKYPYKRFSISGV